MSPRLPLLTALLLALAACAAPTPPAAPVEPAPVRVTVTDLDAFQRFIATMPGVEAFKAHYPGLRIVLPGEPTTKELRGDNSRYFAQLDGQGRITGGQFQ